MLLLLGLGLALRRLGLIDGHFVARANALVFNVALPAMLYFAIASRPLDEAFDATLAGVGFAGTLVLIGLLLVVGRLLPADRRGVFVQGGYRGNLAILGLALSVAAYGEGVLPLVAVYLAIVTTLYNVVAVWVLDSDGALRSIARNPIIIAIAAGSVASLAGWSHPSVLVRTGDTLSGMVLPVALLCIGASIELRALAAHAGTLALAAAFKLVISPLLLVGLGLAAGLSGERLGVLFFLAASPTATASYIMARQMTRHGALAAEIVAATTAVGVPVYTLGLALLRAYGHL